MERVPSRSCCTGQAVAGGFTDRSDMGDMALCLCDLGNLLIGQSGSALDLSDQLCTDLNLLWLDAHEEQERLASVSGSCRREYGRDQCCRYAPARCLGTTRVGSVHAGWLCRGGTRVGVEPSIDMA